MSNPRNSGRGDNAYPDPIQRGEPARGSRNQRRAYEFQQDRAVRKDWTEVREFEERPVKSRGPTNRSQSWKNKRNEKKNAPQKKDDAAVSYDFKATDETAPIDEPMYDLGPHSSAIPVQETYAQNFEFSGFIDQVERTYESLRGIDPRLDRRMPYSMFQHSMATILNAYLLDLTLENGERKMGATRMQDLLPEDLNIPDNLYHYMTTIGNTTTVGGEEVKFNLPDIAVPQPAADGIPAGSFGPVNAQTHNVYECYISPLVTMNRVLNSRRPAGDPEIPPLPPALVPAGGLPNRNLLGHGPPDIIPLEGRARIEGFDFPEGDSDAARLRVCPELMSRVNTVLFEMRNRYKMRNIGRSSPDMRNYLRPKVIPGSVQFVRVTEHTPDVVKLSQKQNQIISSSTFGSATAGQNNVHVHRRERNANARGACYTVNGAVPAGWIPTINNNFNMIAPFVPTVGVNNPAIRVVKFISHAPGGSRLTAIDNYIKRNFYIPAK